MRAEHGYCIANSDLGTACMVSCIEATKIAWLSGKYTVSYFALLGYGSRSVLTEPSITPACL